MEVKIYRELETENLILDEQSLLEYNELALELGISTKEKAEDNRCPVVYPILNEAMQRQLKALCPSSIEAEKYTRTTIPLEVLKVMKFCKDNQMFDDYRIWFDDKTPDPLLIGYSWRDEESKAKGYSWQKNKYLIARWGDCAKEIPQLLSDGFEVIKAELQSKAVTALEKCNSVIKHPEIYARKIINGDSSDMSIDLRTSGDSTF